MPLIGRRARSTFSGRHPRYRFSPNPPTIPAEGLEPRRFPAQAAYRLSAANGWNGGRMLLAAGLTWDGLEGEIRCIWSGAMAAEWLPRGWSRAMSLFLSTSFHTEGIYLYFLFFLPSLFYSRINMHFRSMGTHRAPYYDSQDRK